MKYYLIILFIFLGSKMSIEAQEILPFNNEFNQYIDAKLFSSDLLFHNSFKPYIIDKNTAWLAADSLQIYYREKKQKDVRWLHRKLRYENLIQVDTDDFKLNINPLFHVELRKVQNSTLYDYINSRGLSIDGFIGKNIYFYTNFFENQAAYSGYIGRFIKKTNVVPGQGLSKGFGNRGYDYSTATGIISISAKKYFNIQFGHGKNFIGNGYRSMLLSDNTYNYPFLKIQTNIWKIQYTNLYTSFLDIKAPHSYPMGFQKKSGSFHYLSVLLGKRLNIGLFEGIVWQNYDSTRTRGFDVNYFNPIIFFRPVEFSLGSPDNAIVGLNVNYKIGNNTLAYGQLVIDDINFQKMQERWGYLQNKYGFQLGFVSNNLFGVKNLTIRSEYNHAQPYTYAHKNPIQNYAHYYQPLAHPLGANFIESVNILNYRWRDFFVQLKFSYAEKGTDTLTSHWGGDIFISDNEAQNGLFSYGNSVGQGVKQYILHRDFTISYFINPKTNLNIAAGVFSRRMYSNVGSEEYTYFFFALRTSITNFYFDF